MATVEEMLVSPNLNLNGSEREKSQDEQDHDARQWWKESIGGKVEEWWKLVPDVNKVAYSEAYEETALGYCVLDIPYELGLMLANEYGWEAFHDKDFIRFAQKSFGQQFMPSV
jgi:hypothetical protein